MRLLIVDNQWRQDPLFEQFVGLLNARSKRDWKIDYASDAIQGARELVKAEGGFSVVILDQDMGGGEKDGTALLRKVAKLPKKPEIIFITRDFNLIPASEILTSGVPISLFIQKNALAAEMLCRAVMLVACKQEDGYGYGPEDIFGQEFIPLVLAEVARLVETPIAGYMSLDQQKQVGAVIRSFFLGLKARRDWGSEDLLQLTVFFLDALCGIFSVPPSLVAVVRKFLDLEDILYTIPRYRDHFFHQVKVFLLGFCIVNELNRRRLVEGSIFDHERGMKIWFLTSVFHDIGYPFQEMDKWLESYFESVLRSPGDTSRDKLLKVQFNWGSLLAVRYHAFHIQEVPRLICESYKSDADAKTKREVYAELLTRMTAFVTEAPDHGLYSSIILQNLLREKIEGFEIDQICVAVALHNDAIAQVTRSALREPLTFECDPLSFMLAFCDLAQEWGRTQGFPQNSSAFLAYGFPQFKSGTLYDEATKTVTVRILYDRDLTPVQVNDWNDKVYQKYIAPMAKVWRMSASNQYHIHFAINYYCLGDDERKIDSLHI